MYIYRCIDIDTDTRGERQISETDAEPEMLCDACSFCPAFPLFFLFYNRVLPFLFYNRVHSVLPSLCSFSFTIVYTDIGPEMSVPSLSLLQSCSFCPAFLPFLFYNRVYRYRAFNCKNDKEVLHQAKVTNIFFLNFSLMLTFFCFCIILNMKSLSI